MCVSDAFCLLFDNVRTICPPCKSNFWSIHEGDKSAKLKCLDVVGNAIQFTSFNQYLTKNMPCITSKRSNKLKDNECDGIAFVETKNKEDLLFVELKSKYDPVIVVNAVKQMCFSFLKMHAMLSLCSGYALGNIEIHFCVATRCAVNKDEKDQLALVINQALQSPNRVEQGRILKKLFAFGWVETKLDHLLKGEDVCEPLHYDLKNKNIKVHLVTSSTPNDTKAVFNHQRQQLDTMHS